MPDAIGAIAPILGIGTSAAGIIGNIMNARTRGQQTSQLQSAENKYANLTPEQLSGMVTKAEAPLNQSLLNQVGNLVQANVASRGLAESPGVFATTESQALAPYQQENQNTALQLVMKQLGLPIEYAQAIINSIGPNSNISPIVQALMQMKGGMPSGFGGGPAPAPPAPPFSVIQQANPWIGSTPGLTMPNNFTGPTDTGDIVG
jgi:hypothetical protein